LSISHTLFCFNGGEVVRLKDDHADNHLKAGDCGLVGGIYDFEPPIYEASFGDRFGEFINMMFQEEQVEELTNPQEAQFIK
jgi:hypothetical protein